MGILSDRQIRTEVKITPFKDYGPKEPGTISSGLGSFGYDVRLGYKFKVFSPIHATVIDPKNFDPKCLVDVDLTPEDHRWTLIESNRPVGMKNRFKCHKCGVCIETDSEDRTKLRPIQSCKVPADHLLIPPHSFVLAESLEHFDIPRDILCVVVGKSTYARCFSAGTRVKLVDGTTPTLKEMAERWDNGEREFYGFGVKDGKYVAQKLVAPRKVGRDRIVVVRLDNGKKIRCTPDHKFCLRRGGSKRADELTPGDSLMPLYTSVASGYERVWDPFVRKFMATSHLVDDLLVREGKLPPRQPNEDVHHRDENKRNNCPKNLERMTEQDHGRHHNAKRDMSAQAKVYWTDPEKKKTHLKVLHAPEVRAKAGKSRSQFYQTDQGKKVSQKARQKGWAVRGEAGREAQAAVMRNLKLRKDVTEDRVRQALLETGSIRGASQKLKVDRSAFRRFPDLIQAFKAGELQNNHKVVSVEFTDKVEDVYCLTAPDTGNFALAAGVVVHNCGLIVNVTPGEPEWPGYWTIELSNTTPLPVKVYPGEGIMQCLFFRSDEKVCHNPLVPPHQPWCERSYKDKVGKYQNQTGLTLPKAEPGETAPQS